MVKPYIHPMTNMMTFVLNNGASIQLQTTMVKRTLPYFLQQVSCIPKVLHNTPYLAVCLLPLRAKPCLEQNTKRPRSMIWPSCFLFLQDPQWLTVKLRLVWEFYDVFAKDPTNHPFFTGKEKKIEDKGQAAKFFSRFGRTTEWWARTRAQLGCEDHWEANVD